MTLVWLAATLTVIVAGAVFAVWTVRIHTIRSGRLIQLHRNGCTPTSPVTATTGGHATHGPHI